jgi:outer membrane protein TolC
MQNAMLDVEQNYLAVGEAAERIAATSKLVEQADESLHLAEKQYAAGVGTAIDVTDAQVARANAHITAIQALYDHTIALTRLRQAMGTPENLNSQ